MGTVYTATHPALGRTVAVKFLDAELAGGDLSARFLDEARITASLKDRNIIDIFDFGDLDGRFYYVMELLDGQDLGEEMAGGARLPLPTIINYLAQICSGLQTAHLAGIVHRDLKPANIFVLDGHPLTIKLMDFGVAKILETDSKKTNYGQILGTPAYMAPEQALGDVSKISAQTDIYALGVIAYEMLSGRRPFEHEAPMMLLVAHIHETITKLNDVAPHVPPALAAVVEACLSKDPKDRPASAKELGNRLDEAMKQPVPRSVRRDEAKTDTLLDEKAALREEKRRKKQQRLEEKQRARDEERRQRKAKREQEREAEDVAPGISLADKKAAPESPSATSEHQPLEHRATVQFKAPEVRTLELAEKKEVTVDAAAVTQRPVLPQPSHETMISSRAPEISESPPASFAHRDTLMNISADSPAGLHTLGIATNAVTMVSGDETVTLDEGDRNILKKLLQRMKRRGDLPAFVANVGDVNKKADFEGKYSANQLSEAILKDHALTAKLLRVVNTTYVQRFGGKIYSVQQAIVILGFEQVRSIALSISVFDKSKGGPNAARVADSSVHSLVSGEIAKELTTRCQLKDVEKSMVCSMFCNLGRHLAIVYLPDQYDNALARAAKDGISLDRAAEKELGLSFQKIGIGVAEQWHLPPQLLEAMASPLPAGAKLVGDEQRFAALAQLSNDLCELVATGLTGPSDPKLRKLLHRHENLLILDPEEVPELMANVEEGFRERYASLLGKASQGSRFLQRLPEFSPQSMRRREQLLATAQVEKSAHKAKASSKESPAPAAKKKGKRAVGAPRAVQALKLGQQGPAPAGKPSVKKEPVPDPLSSLREAMADRERRNEAWETALSLISEQLDLPRLVALRANDNATELVASHAFGADATGLKGALRFQLNPSPTNPDVFSRAFHLKKDIVVKDSFSEKSSTQVPARYFEVLGSPAFAVLVCNDGEHAPTLILADVDDPTTLPSRSRLGSIDALKALLAQAAA